MKAEVFFKNGMSGEINAVGSKSELHRCIICAAFADKPTKISNLNLCDDIKATLSCVCAIGARVTFDKIGNAEIIPPKRPRAEKPLNCGESAAALRFMLALTAAGVKNATLTALGSLLSRPISDLAEALEGFGAEFSSKTLPITVNKTVSKPGNYKINANITSQYISGLLLALPLLPFGSSVEIPENAVSAPYIALTAQVMHRFGVPLYRAGNALYTTARSYSSPKSYTAGGDWSGASCLLAAAALSGDIKISGLPLPSLQSDSAFAEILHGAGVKTEYIGNSFTAYRAEKIHLEKTDISPFPDLLPALALLACGADSEVEFTGTARLRYKESDRAKAVAAALSEIGVKAEAGEDCLKITPSRPRGGEADCRGDHRIAFMLACASAISENPVVIKGAEAVTKSYPSFFNDIERLGAEVCKTNSENQ